MRQCSIDGCERPGHVRNLCKPHYQRLQRYGDPLELSEWAKGNRDSSEKWRARKMQPGHVSKGQGGYLVVYLPESPMANSRGHVFQHRAVMSDHIGRPLSKDETVHHVNGDITDNRIENLELWTSRHPKGQRVEDLVAFAREILERYGEQVDDGVI